MTIRFGAMITSHIHIIIIVALSSSSNRVPLQLPQTAKGIGVPQDVPGACGRGRGCITSGVGGGARGREGFHRTGPGKVEWYLGTGDRLPASAT